MKLSELKLNPNNPRIIKDEKFKKLVKSMRGVKKKGTMISSCLTGAFRDEKSVRDEFMSLIKK